MFAASRVKRH